MAAGAERERERERESEPVSRLVSSKALSCYTCGIPHGNVGCMKEKVDFVFRLSLFSGNCFLVP